jgi:hypothetical protein
MNNLLKPVLVIAATCCMAFILTLAPSKTFADENDTFLSPGIKLTPSTLNMKSKGKFITAFVRLPGAFSDELPPPADVILHLLINDNETGDVVALRTDRGFWGQLVVKFSRSEVQELIAENIDQFPATVSFSISIDFDNETLSYTDDTRVIKPGKKAKK